MGWLFLKQWCWKRESICNIIPDTRNVLDTNIEVIVSSTKINYIIQTRAMISANLQVPFSHTLTTYALVVTVNYDFPMLPNCQRVPPCVNGNGIKLLPGNAHFSLCYRPVVGNPSSCPVNPIHPCLRHQ